MSWDINKIASGIAILAAFGSVVLYISKLESRIEKLEAQISISAPNSKSDKASSVHDSTRPDALAESCKELAARAAAQYQGGWNTSADKIQDMMKNMGCIK